MTGATPRSNDDLIDFTARLCRLREAAPGVPPPAVLPRRAGERAGRDDLDWYRPDGEPMTGEDWSASFARAVTMALSGATGDHTGPDDPFLIMLNAWWEPLEFSLPVPLRRAAWRLELDTAGAAVPDERRVTGADPVTLIGRSLVLLRSPRSPG